MGVIERLASEDLEMICAVLVSYTVNRSRMMYGWYTDESGMLPNSMSPVDIVHTAIQQTITQERTWNEEKHATLLLHLKSTVNSLLSNTYRSWINRYVSRYDSEKMARLPDHSHEGTIRHVLIQRVVQKLRERMVDRPELIEVIDAILEGYEKPREIAEQIGVEADEIYKRMRRIRRLVFNYAPDLDYHGLIKDVLRHA